MFYFVWHIMKAWNILRLTKDNLSYKTGKCFKILSVCDEVYVVKGSCNPKKMELELKLKQLEIEKLRVEKWNGVYVSTNNYGPIPVSTNTNNQWQ